jgi:prepilin-type N-terminal cleavage/methylation domain-containing protein
MRLPRLRKTSAFTLIEMLTVAALFSIITTVIAVLFSQGTYTYRHGENHLEMQRGGRYLAARITPYLASMIDAFTPTKTPLRKDIDPAANKIAFSATEEMGVDPNRGDPASPPVDPDAAMVYFTTTEDWLGPDYPSQLTSSTLALSTADLSNYTYRIRYSDPDPATMGDGEVLLERLLDAGGNDWVVDTDLRLYMEKQEAIENFRFVRVRSNLLQLRFGMQSVTKSAANQDQTVREEFRYTFNLPSKSL